MTTASAVVCGQKAKQKSQEQEGNESDENDRGVVTGVDFHRKFCDANSAAHPGKDMPRQGEFACVIYSSSGLSSNKCFLKKGTIVKIKTPIASRAPYR